MNEVSIVGFLPDFSFCKTSMLGFMKKDFSSCILFQELDCVFTI